MSETAQREIAKALSAFGAPWCQKHEGACPLKEPGDTPDCGCTAEAQEVMPIVSRLVREARVKALEEARDIAKANHGKFSNAANIIQLRILETAAEAKLTEGVHK
jgi:hypothetical protein